VTAYDVEIDKRIAVKFEGTTLDVIGILNAASEEIAVKFEGTTLDVMGLFRVSDCA
jgi:hypothetical protein